MSRGLVVKIGWELDNLKDYISELQDEESKKSMECTIEIIRDYLSEMESEIDDINRCLGRIV